MKKVMMMLLVMIFVLFGMAQAQGPLPCLKCSNQLCVSKFSGHCSCDADPPFVCSTCGFCTDRHCTIPCAGPETKQQKAIDAALSTWTWVKDPDLEKNVGAVSPVLGRLVWAEQRMIAKSKCPRSFFRQGTFTLTNKTRKSAEWYSVVNGHEIRYLIVSGYGTQPRELVLTKDKWQVRKNKQLISEGMFLQIE